MTDRIDQRTVGEFLDAVADRAPAPSAGAVAAVAVSAAAALVTMAARLADVEYAGLADEARQLREEALTLGGEDGAAYAAVLAAYRLPRSEPGRQQRITTAMQAATEIPIQIARVGSEVATIAGTLATRGNPNLRGDAQAAALIAEGATKAATALAHANTDLGGLPRTWTDRAEGHLQAAQAATATALDPMI